MCVRERQRTGRCCQMCHHVHTALTGAPTLLYLENTGQHSSIMSQYKTQDSTAQSRHSIKHRTALLNEITVQNTGQHSSITSQYKTQDNTAQSQHSTKHRLALLNQITVQNKALALLHITCNKLYLHFGVNLPTQHPTCQNISGR